MSEPRWRIAVDRELCTGSGMCAGGAPRHFSVDGGRSTPVAEVVPEDPAVLDAAETCPVEAIRVYALDSGEQLAPEPLNL